MTEPIAVKVGRLEERLSSLERVVESHEVTAVAHRLWLGQHLDEMAKTLKLLVSMGDEWRGVRKTLSGLAAFLLAVGTIIGASLGYLWPHHK